MHGRTCGLDEAGRGAWAGPLVAAAVVLPCAKNTISRRAGFKLRDGKLLTEKQRRKVYGILKKIRAEITIEVISTRSVNNHGIGWANREIFRRLIKRINADEYIVDGKIRVGKIIGKPNIRSVVRADSTVSEVICSGIVAKVERDRIMTELHKKFPYYHWKENSGYGTAAHLLAVEQFDLTIYHRRIYVATAMRNKTRV